MIKVLHLTSWYPSHVKPLEGIFVRKHIEAVSMHCLSAVLYITLNSKLSHNYTLESFLDNNILTTIVYTRQSAYRIRLISKLITIKNFCIGLCAGLKFIKKDFGSPSIINLHIVSRIGFIALLYKYFKGIPYIITEHSTLYVEKKLKSNTGKTLRVSFEELRDKLIFQKAEKIIVVSKFLANVIKDKFGLSKEFIVIPNVIDVPDEKFLIKTNNDKNIIALTISLLKDDHKGINDLIKAFIKVINDKKNLELHIVGDGMDRAILEKTASDSNLLNKKIFFHGAIENNKLFHFFQNAHFFVLNSRYETFSVVTAESLSYGVPVLISKCGGPEEYINGELGFLYEKFNESELIKGIELMYEHWKDYDQLKLRKFVIDHFPKMIVGKKIYEVYTQCLRS